MKPVPPVALEESDNIELRRAFDFLGLEIELSLMVEGEVSTSGAGRRKVWTTPEAKPTLRTGFLGWMAWERRSALRGRVQSVSYIWRGGPML